jgi:1-acyl-sn-glycerol-3-phosphate acyltransferase
MGTIKGIVASVYIAFNTIFWCIPVYLGGIARLLVPVDGFQRQMGALLSHVIDGWVACNRLLMKALKLTHISATWKLNEPLHRHSWYLVVSNHQTWADILVLQESFLGTVPPLSFFVKRPLLWLPGLGLAMWFLDFPYVRRYSRDVLAANPELRIHDQESTRRACDHFKHRPTSVLNFVEGTRFTAEKKTAHGSDYQHLLNPKVGGLATVVEALSDRLDRLVDVTIAYPTGAPSFWEFLCGTCGEVRMEVSDRQLPDAVLHPATSADTDVRQDLRVFVDALWEAKDQRISELLAS